MNILFLDAYFYPEVIAFSHIEMDLMEGLMGAGHRITVVCPTPCRGIPEDIIRKYRHIKNETYHGIHIIRYRTPREGKNPLVRAFRYFYCNIRGNMISKRQKDIDAVFAVSTPPTQGYFAGKLSKKLKVPLIYSLQDVFPDSLVTAGLSSKGSPVYRLGAKIEKKTYSLCSKIIVLSDTMRQNLLRKGVAEEKLKTVSNWIDTEEVKPVKKEDNRLFEEYRLDRNRFNVVYAGNLGASQGADVILKTARLSEGNDNIRFIIFGSGTELEAIKAEAEKLKLSNIAIHPLLPPERIPEVYSLGDAALITCKKGAGKTALPSKTYSIMACGTPIIASFDTDSELSAILKESGAGVCVRPQDPQALKEAIEKAYERRTDTAETSQSARDYVTSHASKDICVREYIDAFEEAVGEK